MKPQNFAAKNERIRADFTALKKSNPKRLKNRLNLSWSNWGFGLEPLADSAARLERAGITWIELHGNHYGPDLGYKPAETLKILGDHGIKVAGVCGMFSPDNDLSSNRAIQRQAAIDYIRRELAFAKAVGGSYLLVVPGAVGRPQKYDDSEFHRSVETLRLVATDFVKAGVRAAIAQATDNFHREYKADFSGEERYWEQAIILADLSAKLALEWGLIAFERKDAIEWVLAQVGAIRRTVSEFKTDAFDMLSEYLNENADAQVQIFHTGTQKPTMDYNRVPRGEVRVRFDFYRKTSGEPVTNGVLLLDRTHLRRWLSQHGVDYKTFISEFTDENIISTPKSNKAYLAKDTPIKLGQSYVIGLNLNHPRLQGMLSDADEVIENLTLGQVKAV
jgi:sugar phosphate isomerase/epimerase